MSNKHLQLHVTKILCQILDLKQIYKTTFNGEDMASKRKERINPGMHIIKAKYTIRELK